MVRDMNQILTGRNVLISFVVLTLVVIEVADWCRSDLPQTHKWPFAKYSELATFRSNTHELKAMVFHVPHDYGSGGFSIRSLVFIVARSLSDNTERIVWKYLYTPDLLFSGIQPAPSELTIGQRGLTSFGVCFFSKPENVFFFFEFESYREVTPFEIGSAEQVPKYLKRHVVYTFPDQNRANCFGASRILDLEFDNVSRGQFTKPGIEKVWWSSEGWNVQVKFSNTPRCTFLRPIGKQRWVLKDGFETMDANPLGKKLAAQLRDSDSEASRKKTLQRMATFWRPKADDLLRRDFTGNYDDVSAIVDQLPNEPIDVATVKASVLTTMIEHSQNHFRGTTKRDRYLVIDSFELLSAMGHDSAGYGLARTLGNYLNEDFKVDRNDPKYQANPRSFEQYSIDCVGKALEWWEENRARIVKPK